LIPGTVSIWIIFEFTYMCTYYLYHIHLPTPFPATAPPTSAKHLPPQNLFHPPVLQFCRRKIHKR
jgi:hypothetical protein